MKNKNIVIIAIVVLLLLLLGAGGYLMLNKNATKSTEKAPGNSAKPTQAMQSEKSLLDLIKMGQNLRCTFTTTVENGSSNGTVYVSGQNVRADFAVKISNSKEMQTSMIKKGDTSYIWGTSMEGKGIKMTLALDKVSGNSQANQYVNPNQKVNYNCEPWNVDESLFTVPTDVQFTDMTSFMMPKATGTTTQEETQSSDPCSRLAGDVKIACENALKQTSK